MPASKALVIVFAMPGCPACGTYMPKFDAEIARWREHHAPFVDHELGKQYSPGEIPVAVYDVTSKDASIQALCDSYAITNLPTTLVLRWNGPPIKLEGDISDEELYGLLQAATIANR